MRIAVYCGSRSGSDPAYETAARELGRWMGANGHTLVYGAGFQGMMGAVSETVWESGGAIIGIIPEFMVRLGWQKKELVPVSGECRGSRGVLLVTESMSTRKAKMLELSDVCIALPGGPGTLEEITEAISLSCVNQHGKECILLNLNGYYEPLRSVYEDMIQKGFTDRELLRHVHYAADVQEIIRILQDLPSPN